MGRGQRYNTQHVIKETLAIILSNIELLETTQDKQNERKNDIARELKYLNDVLEAYGNLTSSYRDYVGQASNEVFSTETNEEKAVAIKELMKDIVGFGDVQFIQSLAQRAKEMKAKFQEYSLEIKRELDFAMTVNEAVNILRNKAGDLLGAARKIAKDGDDQMKAEAIEVVQALEKSNPSYSQKNALLKILLNSTIPPVPSESEIDQFLSENGIVVDDQGHVRFTQSKRVLPYNLIVMRHGHTLANGGVIHISKLKKKFNGVNVNIDELIHQKEYFEAIAGEEGLLKVNEGKVRASLSQEEGPVKEVLQALLKEIVDQRRLQGLVDDDELNQLTQEGIEQARQKAPVILGMIHRLIEEGKASAENMVFETSLLRRSRITAQPSIELAKENGFQVTVLAAAKNNEHSYGAYDNKSRVDLSDDSVAQEFYDQYRNNMNVNIKPPEGLSLKEEIYITLVSLLEEEKLYKGKTVVKFGHGAKLSMLRIAMRDPEMIDPKLGYVNYQTKILPNTTPIILNEITPKNHDRSIMVTRVENPYDESVVIVDVAEGRKFLENALKKSNGTIYVRMPRRFSEFNAEEFKPITDPNSFDQGDVLFLGSQILLVKKDTALAKESALQDYMNNVKKVDSSKFKIFITREEVWVKHEEVENAARVIGVQDDVLYQVKRLDPQEVRLIKEKGMHIRSWGMFDPGFAYMVDSSFPMLNNYNSKDKYLIPANPLVDEGLFLFALNANNSNWERVQTALPDQVRVAHQQFSITANEIKNIYIFDPKSKKFVLFDEFYKRSLDATKLNQPNFNQMVLDDGSTLDFSKVKRLREIYSESGSKFSYKFGNSEDIVGEIAGFLESVQTNEINGYIDIFDNSHYSVVLIEGGKKLLVGHRSLSKNLKALNLPHGLRRALVITNEESVITVFYTPSNAEDGVSKADEYEQMVGLFKAVANRVNKKIEIFTDISIRRDNPTVIVPNGNPAMNTNKLQAAGISNLKFIGSSSFTVKEVHALLDAFNQEKLKRGDDSPFVFNQLKESVAGMAQKAVDYITSQLSFDKTVKSRPKMVEQIKMIYSLAFENAIDVFMQKRDGLPPKDRGSFDKLVLSYYFYRTHANSTLDVLEDKFGLLIVNNGVPLASAETTKTKSIRRAKRGLGNFDRFGGKGLALSYYMNEAFKQLLGHEKDAKVRLFDREALFDDQQGAVLDIQMPLSKIKGLINGDSDSAVLTQSKLNQKYGGIDLNPALMRVEVKQQGESFKFDYNGKEIDAAQIVGAKFTILSMTPVTNIAGILGVSSN